MDKDEWDTRLELSTAMFRRVIELPEELQEQWRNEMHRIMWH
jgi:hypothetical protein